MATIYKRGRSWYLSWQEAGKQHRRSLGQVDRQTASEALQGLRRRLVLGDPQPSDWHGFLRQYLSWHERTYPDSHYRVRDVIERLIMPAFPDWPVSRDIDRWASMRPVAPATVNKELAILQAAARAAHRWGLTQVLPSVRMRPVQATVAPRAYSEAELQSIYEADPEYAPVWRLMANTGLRRGEALRARRRDIEDGRLRVMGKGGRERVIPLGPGALQALEQLGDDYLLPRVVPNSLTRRFRLCAPRGSLHSLRHTFCTMLVARGVHLRVVQELAGHSTVAVTERYARALAADLGEAVARLDL